MKTKIEKKGLMQMPVIGYGVATGIQPDIAVQYKSLLHKPAISWGNVGCYPKGAQFNQLKEKIKQLTGFGWANNIESLYYYDGAHTFFRFPFCVHLFFKQTSRDKTGEVPNVKTCYKYEISIFDPIRRESLLTQIGELKYWNSRFDVAHIDRIGSVMKRFIDTVLNTKANYDLLEKFKQELKTPDKRYENSLSNNG